jgi:hypothetical protein
LVGVYGVRVLYEVVAWTTVTTADTSTISKSRIGIETVLEEFTS